MLKTLFYIYKDFWTSLHILSSLLFSNAVFVFVNYTNTVKNMVLVSSVKFCFEDIQ